tara:strand:+ start:321 stop:662 length:342 start_codon:yes stop_codon:yes gene_type:complete
MSNCDKYLLEMKQLIDNYLSETYCPDNKIKVIFEKTIQNIKSIESDETNPCNNYFKNETNYLHFHKVVLGNYISNNIDVSIYPYNYNGLGALKNFSLHIDDLINIKKGKIDAH